MNSAQPTDLKEVLERDGPLDPARAVSLVRQIAAAIDDAHANQSVHRDITPATILLADNDYAYLADIGTTTAAADTSALRALTFRAPELLGNTEVTYRADIYALAAVLFECLTGSPPYPESNSHTDAPALISAHLTAPIPRPSERRSGIPGGFDVVVARGMAKTPGDRYRTAAELVNAAQAALTTTPHATPSNRPTNPDTTPSSATGDTRTVELALPASAQPDQLRWDPVVGRSPTVSYPHSRPLPLPVPTGSKRRLRSRRGIALLVAVIAVVIAVAGTAAIAIPRLTQHTVTAPTKHTYTSKPTVLPFGDLNNPISVAVDGTGNVYVLSSLLSSVNQGNLANRLVKLAPGAAGSTTMDFPGVDIRYATDLAADAVGNLYLSAGNVVWVLAPGAANPIRLPFRGFVAIDAIAVDPAGNVYAAGGLSRVSGGVRYGVKKLGLGASKPTDLPFTDLYVPKALVADKADNVYVGSGVANKTTGRIFRLAAGANTPTELDLPRLNDPARIAVDTAGNLFIAEAFGRVLEVPAGATSPLELPFKVKTTGVAVDSAGNVYVVARNTKDKSDRVLHPAEVLKLAPDK